MNLIPVSRENPELTLRFLELGRDYLSNLPEENRERFLQSILDLQGESERWLLLLEVEGDHIGFVHMKIDRDDRLGWGFIMEFYIEPQRRRTGWGCRMFGLCREILVEYGARDIWLTTNPEAEPFWTKLGFEDTGMIDRRNDLKIMTMSIL